MNFKFIKILNTEPSRFSLNSREKLKNIVTTFEYESNRNYLIKNINKYDGILVGLKK